MEDSEDYNLDEDLNGGDSLESDLDPDYAKCINNKCVACKKENDECILGWDDCICKTKEDYQWIKIKEGSPEWLRNWRRQYDPPLKKKSQNNNSGLRTESQKLRFLIFSKHKFTCQYCGAKAPEVKLEIDHILPISKGGMDCEDNLTTSCQDCNRGKLNDFIVEPNGR